MWNIAKEDPLAASVTKAIQEGDIAGLERLLAQNEGLARARVVDRKGWRSLLHIAADWPGHFPSGADTVRTLIAAGADPNDAVHDPKPDEAPLHWAASSDDV